MSAALSAFRWRSFQIWRSVPVPQCQQHIQGQALETWRRRTTMFSVWPFLTLTALRFATIDHCWGKDHLQVTACSKGPIPIPATPSFLGCEHRSRASGQKFNREVERTWSQSNFIFLPCWKLDGNSNAEKQQNIDKMVLEPRYTGDTSWASSSELSDSHSESDPLARVAVRESTVSI